MEAIILTADYILNKTALADSSKKDEPANNEHIDHCCVGIPREWPCSTSGSPGYLVSLGSDTPQARRQRDAGFKEAMVAILDSPSPLKSFIYSYFLIFLKTCLISGRYDKGTFPCCPPLIST
jgi:hypothetical protein